MQMFSFYTKNCISEVVTVGQYDRKLLPLLGVFTGCEFEYKYGSGPYGPDARRPLLDVNEVQSDCEDQRNRAVMEEQI